MAKIEQTRVNLGRSIGFETLVARCQDGPPPWTNGNCCAIANMYSENAREFAKLFPEVANDCEVYSISDTREYNGSSYHVHGYYVTDPRIPSEWLNNTHDCKGIIHTLREAGKIQ